MPFVGELADFLSLGDDRAALVLKDMLLGEWVGGWVSQWVSEEFKIVPL